MAYHFETVRLDKGMYGESGCSFTEVLEKCDPSEQYRGTPLERLDAYGYTIYRTDLNGSVEIHVGDSYGEENGG